MPKWWARLHGFAIEAAMIRPVFVSVVAALTVCFATENSYAQRDCLVLQDGTRVCSGADEAPPRPGSQSGQGAVRESVWLNLLFAVDNGPNYSSDTKRLIENSDELFKVLIDDENVYGYSAGRIDRGPFELGSVDPASQVRTSDWRGFTLDELAAADKRRLSGVGSLSGWPTARNPAGSLVLSLYKLLSERDLQGSAQVGGLMHRSRPHAIVFVVGERDTCEEDPSVHGNICAELDAHSLQTRIRAYFEDQVYVAVIALSSSVQQGVYAELANMMGGSGRVFSAENRDPASIMRSLGQWLSDKVNA